MQACPVLIEHVPDEVEYLFWVGCYGSFENPSNAVKFAPRGTEVEIGPRP